MTDGLSDEKKLEMYKDIMNNEVNVHWQRNSYFLISSSILLVATGLLNEPIFHIALGGLGITLNLVWLTIQHRSSKYIQYWKKHINDLAKKLNLTEFYPKNITRIEMRKLAYILPLPFLAIWFVIFLAPIFGWSLDLSSISNKMQELTAPAG